jgi:hypothetical protein
MQDSTPFHILSSKRNLIRLGPTIRVKRQDVLVFFVALAYAIVLVSLPQDGFRDRANYLTYATASDVVLQRYVSQGITSILANEPLWLLTNMALSRFLPPEKVIAVIIGVSAFITAWLVLRSKPQHFVWLLLFLLYPGVIKNYIIHLRQGLAIAIFLVGWFSSRRAQRWLLLGLTPFIHASFFFVIAILLLARFSRKTRLSASLSLLLFVTATAVMILSLQWAAAGLGARQANEYELLSTSGASGAAFVFWSAMLMLMLLEGKVFLRQHRFEVGSMILYLVTYFFIPVTARVFESALVLILIAGLDLSANRGRLFKLAILAFATLQWANGNFVSSLLLES